MTIRDELQPQPDPTPSTGDVWLEIISLMPNRDILKPYCIERRQQGIDRYGTPLQRDNGRDHLLDALQEALDMIAYIEALYGNHEGIEARISVELEYARAYGRLVASMLAKAVAKRLKSS